MRWRAPGARSAPARAYLYLRVRVPLVHPFEKLDKLPSSKPTSEKTYKNALTFNQLKINCMLPFLLVFILPLLLAVGLAEGGIWAWSPLIYAFGVIPSLELFWKPDPKNWSPEEEDAALRNPGYDAALRLVVPVQWACLLVFLYVFATDLPNSWSDRVGLTLGMGLCCGVLGINVAHELGHRTNPTDQRLAWSLLATSLYLHFFVEHNYGHHRNVGTPEDPSSARPGESLYRFLPRTLYRSAVSAYRLGQQRAKGRLLHNQTVQFWAVEAALVGAVGFVGGAAALAGFVGAAFFGALLLETVNYIEHYGLTRKKISPNRYEDPNIEHSWNSNHWVGRAMLFNLSRHSDHHAHPHRPYSILRNWEESPQMPTGYPGMMLLSALPPVFFWVMRGRIPAK